jgi:trimeric autotransporter adhesin
MQFAKTLFSYCALILLLVGVMLAQQPTVSSSTTPVPRPVNFSGRATDARGNVVSGIMGITFSIYQDQYEGAPLWTETQNVTADTKGNYTVQLGATKSNGLPLELFSPGEAPLLGVRVNGGEEQTRVLLLSVPYALKAADAQTLGGLPVAAFVLAAPPSGDRIAANRSAALARWFWHTSQLRRLPLCPSPQILL